MDRRETDIRSLAGLMRELDLTVLEFSESGELLKIERGDRSSVTTALPAAVPSRSDGAPAAAHDGRESGEMFLSPMVGVFYISPAENADPFVRIGDRVHRGDVLCIIEAMKLMNEITCDRDGVIADVCVSDGQVVDYGHPLFRIKES